MYSWEAPKLGSYRLGEVEGWKPGRLQSHCAEVEELCMHRAGVQKVVRGHEYERSQPAMGSLVDTEEGLWRCRIGTVGANGVDDC